MIKQKTQKLKSKKNGKPEDQKTNNSITMEVATRMKRPVRGLDEV